MQINYSVRLNCLLLANPRALSRARSVSMEPPMTRYSMPGSLLAKIASNYNSK